MKRLKLAAFDLDGTLADTLPVSIAAFGRAVSPYAGHELSREEIVETFGLNEGGMVKAVVKRSPEEALETYYQVFRAMQGEVPPPFPGIVPLLEELKAAGILVALVTGKSETSCRITLETLGLAEMFCTVMTGSEHGNRKAECLRVLMERYGLEAEECVYVGDAASDVRAAREAGMVCYSAAWSPGTGVELLERANPGRVCASVAELRRRLM